MLAVATDLNIKANNIIRDYALNSDVIKKELGRIEAVSQIYSKTEVDNFINPVSIALGNNITATKANTDLSATNQANIATLAAATSVNTANIALNTDSINTNSRDITSNLEKIFDLQKAQAADRDDLKVLIPSNTDHTNKLSQLRIDVDKNTGDIKTLQQDNLTNTAAIGLNKIAITNNTSAITKNRSDFAPYEARIAALEQSNNQGALRITALDVYASDTGLKPEAGFTPALAIYDIAQDLAPTHNACHVVDTNGNLPNQNTCAPKFNTLADEETLTIKLRFKFHGDIPDT